MQPALRGCRMDAPNQEVSVIIHNYLVDGGYDGLFNSDEECACEINDLAPCGQMSDNCRAGYHQKCDCGDHKYHIGFTQEAQQDDK